ncbi:MAG TPA: hypothetical protein VIM55_12480 [Mucilaginibacter sp.]
MQNLKAYTTGIICIVVMIISAGCSSNSKDIKCLPLPVALQAPPNLTFRVVDKATNLDLFFGAAAKYDTSQLKVHRWLNGHLDTAFLHIDKVGQRFNVAITSNRNVTDTVFMNIADQPRDTILFKKTATVGCYPTTYVSAITFDGKLVFSPQSSSTLAILEK